MSVADRGASRGAQGVGWGKEAHGQTSPEPHLMSRLRYKSSEMNFRP